MIIHTCGETSQLTEQSFVYTVYQITESGTVKSAGKVHLNLFKAVKGDKKNNLFTALHNCHGSKKVSAEFNRDNEAAEK